MQARLAELNKDLFAPLRGDQSLQAPCPLHRSPTVPGVSLEYLTKVCPRPCAATSTRAFWLSSLPSTAGGGTEALEWRAWVPGCGVRQACLTSLSNGGYYGPFVESEGWYTGPFPPKSRPEVIGDDVYRATVRDEAYSA
jgi:hypothetical protein